MWIFLDMSINYAILLDTLSYLGISGISIDFLASYLSNRQQYVSFVGDTPVIFKIYVRIVQVR